MRMNWMRSVGRSLLAVTAISQSQSVPLWCRSNWSCYSEWSSLGAEVIAPQVPGSYRLQRFVPVGVDGWLRHVSRLAEPIEGCRGSSFPGCLSTGRAVCGARLWKWAIWLMRVRWRVGLCRPSWGGVWGLLTWQCARMEMLRYCCWSVEWWWWCFQLPVSDSD